MDHEGKDAHLGGTAVVELDGKLLVDCLLVPSRCLELSSLDVLLAGSKATLDNGNSEDGSEDGFRRGISEGCNTGLDSGEIVARGDAGRKAVASRGYQVAKDGKLSDAAVLGLNIAKTIELVLVSVLEKAKRIPKAKRSLNKERILSLDKKFLTKPCYDYT